MTRLVELRRLLSLLLIAPALGCTSFSHVNKPLEPSPPPAERSERPLPVRATIKVDGGRGNPQVLFFLALSGGGSRAAYFSASTMLKLQTVFHDVDLLREVDVISSVSGGSLPGAYYAISRDESLPLVGVLKDLSAPGTLGSISPKLGLAGDALRCKDRLTVPEQSLLYGALGGEAQAGRRVVELCEQAPLGRLRPWNDATVRDLMTRNYLARWFGNWFWPDNIVLYWFTSYDRSDIMAKTFEDNMYDTPNVGLPLVFGDLNPQRPYLILNSTNATEQNTTDALLPDTYAFGTVFTFTDDDFRERLRSDIRKFPISNAVMASSAFPLVFQNVTLRNFWPQFLNYCRQAALSGQGDSKCQTPLYLHVFDGGNSDNLGLRSIKRAIFEMVLGGRLDPKKDKVVVLLVDAFTKPVGALRTRPDPRGLASFVIDVNVADAIDSLLQANRAKIVGEFQTGALRWKEGDCDRDSQNLSPETCRALDKRPNAAGTLDMTDSLFFYHFGFDDVRDETLKRELYRIATSFTISDPDVKSIDEAVNLVLRPDNPCLEQIRLLVQDPTYDVRRARAICSPFDKTPEAPAGK